MKEGTNPELATRAHAESIVKEFYNRYGWVKPRSRSGEAARSGEDALFRQFPDYYFRFYDKKGRQRLQSCFDGSTGDLLIAGCGDMPEAHQPIARRFSRLTCLDISEQALATAREKLSGEAVEASFVNDSILQAPFADNSFGAVLCAHVLFHIDAGEQAAAVRQLIRITRPGGKIVIAYANPRSPFTAEFWKRSWIARVAAPARGHARRGGAPALYYACHPLGWWRQFKDSCNLRILPSDIIGSRQAMLLLKNNVAAVVFYRLADLAERMAPGVAVRFWQYCVVVLEKKAG